MLKVAARGQYDAGIDCGFVLYDCGLPTQNFNRTPREAQLIKFHYAFDKLHLQPGMALLDIGCGMGEWLYWLKNEKQMKCVGLNVTKGHADVVEDRGIPCLNGTWQFFLKKAEKGDREFISLYGGKFDCVTAWDTAEHYFKGQEIYNAKAQTIAYRKLFKFASFLVNKKSSSGMFWISCLHQSRWLNQKPWTWTFYKEWFNCYLLNVHWDGAYPTDMTDDVNYKKKHQEGGKNAELCFGLKHRAAPQFTLEFEENKIEDYRMTSMLNTNHFGSFVFTWNLRLVYQCFCHLLCDPHFFICFYDTGFRRECAWMWSVGGVEKEISPTCPTKLLWQAYHVNADVDWWAEP